MEAYRIDRFGSVDSIMLRSSDDPRSGPKEILLRVRASSLNYRDLMVLKGGGRGPTKLGVIPLSDGAGEVAVIGAGVTDPKPFFRLGWPLALRIPMGRSSRISGQGDLETST
jgi:NADPH:quinone reductase-like Zn-dependent oxidoreductase